MRKGLGAAKLSIVFWAGVHYNHLNCLWNLAWPDGDSARFKIHVKVDSKGYLISYCYLCDCQEHTLPEKFYGGRQRPFLRHTCNWIGNKWQENGKFSFDMLYWGLVEIGNFRASNSVSLEDACKGYIKYSISRSIWRSFTNFTETWGILLSSVIKKQLSPSDW